MRKGLKQLLLATTVATTSAFALASAVEAALSISFSDTTGNIVTVQDNAANDSNTNVGEITVGGLTVGAYSITGTVSQSISAGNTVQLFDTNLTTSGGPGRLVVTTTESNFSLPAGATVASTSITPTSVGGTAIDPTAVNGTLSFVSSIQGTDLTFMNLVAGTSASDTQAVSVTNPFSIQHVATIDHFAGGGITSYDVRTTVTSTPTAVPVPATLALFGAGLVALGWIGRRRA